MHNADLEWRGDALCAETDPEVFFPEKGQSNRSAKQICGACDVTAQCLQYALDNDEHFGVFGGLSENERRKLKAGLPVVQSATDVRADRNARIRAERGRGSTYAEIAASEGLAPKTIRGILDGERGEAA